MFKENSSIRLKYATMPTAHLLFTRVINSTERQLTVSLLFDIVFPSSDSCSPLIYIANFLRMLDIWIDRIHENRRVNFKIDGIPKRAKAEVNYRKQAQIDHFNKVLGRSQHYFTNTSFLSRGHLTPDADFIFSSAQFATYFYANVCPQFQVLIPHFPHTFRSQCWPDDNISDHQCWELGPRWNDCASTGRTRAGKIARVHGYLSAIIVDKLQRWLGAVVFKQHSTNRSAWIFMESCASCQAPICHRFHHVKQPVCTTCWRTWTLPRCVHTGWDRIYAKCTTRFHLLLFIERLFTRHLPANKSRSFISFKQKVK